MKTVSISHGDVDGVVSAALIVRYTNNVAVRLSAASALPKVIRSAMYDIIMRGANIIIISDLNPSPGNIESIVEMLSQYVKAGVKVVWLDHHEWIDEAISAVREIGVELMIDTERVAAEVVYKYLENITPEIRKDKIAHALISLAIDDDRFLNRNPLAIKWRRLLRWYNWEFRRKTVRAFASGELWPHWAQKAYEEIEREYDILIRKALEDMKVIEVKGYKVVVIPPISDKIHPGDLQLELSRRGIDADLFVIMYSKGVSFRSSQINVADLAKSMGGGGHIYSAGAPLSHGNVELVLDSIKRYLAENP